MVNYISDHSRYFSLIFFYIPTLFVNTGIAALMSKSNKDALAKQKIQVAHLVRFSLFGITSWSILTFIAILFFAKGIGWVEKSFMAVLLFNYIRTDWHCINVAGRIISNGRVTTLVKENDVKTLESLLTSEKIDFNTPTSDGKYPLQIAVFLKEYEKVKFMLEHGAFVDKIHDSAGITALTVAAQAGDDRMVALLLAHHANPNVRGDNNAPLPLEVAAVEGHDKVVKLLLEYGAKVDVKGICNQATALGLAAGKAHFSIVKQFLVAGADPKIKDENGCTPLHHAAMYSVSNPEICESNFRKEVIAEKPIANEAQISVVRLLLDYGADPDIKNENGFTPLHHAVNFRNIIVAEMLFRAGANPLLQLHSENNQGKSGLSSIYMAWHNKDYDLAHILSSSIFKRSADQNSLFISYRTSDVQFVRFIAEQLMAGGVPVWFDEYEILTDKKEGVISKEGEFERIIKYAVECSTRAICFTNQKYANSKYCKDEAIALTSRLTRDKVLNVTCPEHSELYEDVPELNGNPVVHLQSELSCIKSEDLDRLWSSVVDVLGIDPQSLRKDESPIGFEMMEWQPGLRYSLDLGGWQRRKTKQPSSSLFSKFRSILAIADQDADYGMDVDGGSFTKSVDDKELGLLVRVGLFAGENRQQFDEFTSRAMYIVAIGKLFEQYLNQSDQIPGSSKLVGLHFLEVEGKGHGALTHYDISHDAWFRHYVIVLDNPVKEQIKKRIDARWLRQNPEAGSEIEFSLQFSLSHSTFEEFCRVAYLMDRVAASLTIC